MYVQIEFELNASLTSLDHLKVEANRDLEKVFTFTSPLIHEKTKSDCKRDLEYAQLNVQHWEDLYHNSCGDIEKLEKVVEDLQLTCHNQKKELEILRPKVIELDELKATLTKHIQQSSTKTESLNDQNIRLERELLVAQKEIELLRLDVERLSKEVDEKEEKRITAEREFSKQLVSVKHDFEEKVRILDSSNEKRREEEIDLLRADMEAQFITQLSDRETEMNHTITMLKELNEKLSREITILKNEKKHFEELYEEERTESGALRLRIQLLTSQQNSLQLPKPPQPEAQKQNTVGLVCTHSLISHRLEMLHLLCFPRIWVCCRSLRRPLHPFPQDLRQESTYLPWFVFFSTLSNTTSRLLMNLLKMARSLNTILMIPCHRLGILICRKQTKVVRWMWKIVN